MEKTFSINIPAEPYGEIDENAVAVNITYNGPAYIVFSLNSNGDFFAMEGEFENLSDINLADFVHEGHTFHVLDADENAFEAALLTTFYTNETLEPYKETLPNGEEIDFSYPLDGVLSVFWERNPKYDPVTKTWSAPTRVAEPIPAADILANIQSRVTELETALANNTYTEEETTAINEWLVWGRAASTNYAGVKGWKIPYLPMPRF